MYDYDALIAYCLEVFASEIAGSILSASHLTSDMFNVRYAICDVAMCDMRYALPNCQPATEIAGDILSASHFTVQNCVINW